MFFSLFLLISAFSMQQNNQVATLTYPVPPLSPSNDLLVILSKPTPSEPVLFLTSPNSFAVYSYNSSSNAWLANSTFNDFQGYITNSSTLILRLPNSYVSNLSSVYLTIYKDTKAKLDYNITFSQISYQQCERPCGPGICSNAKGKCECSKYYYIGYDCSIGVDVLQVGMSVSVAQPADSWTFFRIASDLGASLVAIIDPSAGSVWAFEANNADSSGLPSQFSYAADYFFNPSTHELVLNIDDGYQPYWIWGFYCASAQGCSFNIEISQPNSSTMNFLWIILASIISLALICVATPIILRICIRHRERVRIAEAHNEIDHRQNRLKMKFPEKKYEEGVEKVNCTICLEEFKNGSMVRVLGCAHSFHASCIDEWCISKTACPLCKRDIFAANPIESSISVSQLD
jgi:hypothetical protein